MRADVSLNINLSSDVAVNDYIMIEKEPWPKDVGRTSKPQGILNIGSMIFGGAITDPNCGGLGEFTAPVYVYPSRSTLPFRFAVSHGRIKSSISQRVLREEVIQCSLQSEVEVDYPVSSRISTQWIGLCYDSRGNVIGRPSVSWIRRTLKFGKKVYGSLQVKYYVYREVHQVTIDERGDSIENNFDSVAYCVWSGGVVSKDIDAPSGFGGSLGNCGNGLYGPQDVPGGTSEICQPESSVSYPVAVRANRHIEIDYCSQETISDEITEVVDKGNDEEPCSDGSIITN